MALDIDTQWHFKLEYTPNVGYSNLRFPYFYFHKILVVCTLNEKRVNIKMNQMNVAVQQPEFDSLKMFMKISLQRHYTQRVPMLYHGP